MSGIFVPFSSSTTDVCLLFELTNADPDYAGCNCTHLWCGKLPTIECPYEDSCYFDATLTASCSGGGPWDFDFTLTLTSSSNYTMWFSTTNGTLSGLPTTIGSGTNVVTGRLAYLYGSGVFCLQINAYDSSTQRFCQEIVCLDYYFSECQITRLAGHQLTEVPGSTGIKLIPNPASDKLEIQYGLSSEAGLLTILNIHGRVYKSITLSSYNGSEYISAGDLVPGVYFVRLTGNNGECIEKKLIIIK